MLRRAAIPALLFLMIAIPARAVTLDPAAFPAGTDLTSAYPGVTLLAADLVGGLFVTNSAPGAGEPARFLSTDGFGGGGSYWTNNSGGFVNIFIAQFASPTDFVSIDMRLVSFAPSATSVEGVLEVYGTQGLLESTTVLLTSATTYQTLSVSRPLSEITSVRAYAADDPFAGAEISIVNFGSDPTPVPISWWARIVLATALAGVGFTHRCGFGSPRTNSIRS
jgi:hypothetical protein